MAIDRRHVLAGVTVILAIATGVILLDVLATVFFAITVAYVLTPVARWFRVRGLRPWWASAATSVVGVLGALVLTTPLVVMFVLRIGSLVGLIELIPDRNLVISAFGYTYLLSPGVVQPVATNYVRNIAVSVARAIPVLGIKLTLFGVVVFALLMAGERAKVTVLGVVPQNYHDIIEALAARARRTLTAIYVVQAGTAIGTFLIAIPVFVVLEYQFPFTLAALAGLLQFLPIVGPSILIILLAAVDIAVGNVTRAVLVLVVGGVLIAWLPDPIIRPRLARSTGHFPGSLYFIGFTGGLFSLGVIGVIAGPLAVALLMESTRQLTVELDGHVPPRPTDEVTVAETIPLAWLPPPFVDQEPHSPGPHHPTGPPSQKTDANSDAGSHEDNPDSNDRSEAVEGGGTDDQIKE